MRARYTTGLAALAAASLVALGGCSDGDPRRGRSDGGSGGDAGPATDGGTGDRDAGTGGGDGSTPGCNDPIDVVFVIDVSTSMEDEIESIRSGITSIWTAARELSSEAQFSLVVFVDDVVTVGACAPFASTEGLQTEFESWREFASTNQQPGGSGSLNSDCPENSLDALHTAATSCPWRAGATRIVIHVTDDTFAERPDSLSGVSVEHTYAETVEALTTNMVRVGAFAAPTAEACGAGTSDDTAQGFFDPYMGMDAIPEATGGRAWSIREVRARSLDMATAINELIEDEYCTLY